MLLREPMKEIYLRRNSLKSVPLHDAVSAPQDAGDEEASAESDTNCFELNKPTTSNFKPHGDFGQWQKTMMESFQVWMPFSKEIKQEMPCHILDVKFIVTC